MLRRALYLFSAVVCGFLSVVAMLQSFPVHAGVICVTATGGTPISDALDMAAPGDTIRVAGGNYVENVAIAVSVTLEGGWDATCSNRDVAGNVTTIRPADSTLSVVSIQGNPADPAAISPVLDGFTIRGGRADLGGNHGGGLKVVDSGALIRNNVIRDNSAALLGGGVWVQRGAPRLENNRVEANHSSGGAGNAYGGGVQLEDTQATLTGNYIAANRVSGAYGYGGGVDVSGGGPVTFVGNTIMGNGVVITGNTIGRGGGFAMRNVSATLSADLVQGNVISGFLGFGGGIFVEESVTTILEATIVENIASADGVGDGGGLYAASSTVMLGGARIADNVAATGAAGGAGGAAFWRTQFTVASSLIVGNQSPTVGGLAAGEASTGDVLNSTFWGNEGVGIEASGAMGAETGLKVLNGIFVGHETAISQADAYVTLDVTYNDFYDNDSDGQGFTLDAMTNLFVDPQLSADYHLAEGSAMIDAGFGLVVYQRDFDGEPRVMAGSGGLYLVDIGADEFSGPTQVERPLGEEPADFTLIGPGGPLEEANAMGTNDWIGSAVLGGDVNGDGGDDLLVGARTHTDIAGAVDDSGRVYGLYNDGSRRSGVYDLYDQPSDLEVRSYLPQQHIGFSLVAAHVGGSNARDLIVGSVGGMNGNEPVTGTVYALSGGPSLAGVKTLSPTMQAAWRIKAAESTQSFSELGALAAGQLNGGGAMDLVVGEALASGPGNRQAAGAVTIFFGGSLPALWDLAQTPASLTIYGPAVDAELGQAALGDVDGDGNEDLVARGGNAAYVFYGPLEAGVIDLATDGADAAITGLGFGPLSLGDVDGDGRDDLLLGDGQDVALVRGGALAGSQSVAQAEWSRLTGLGSASSFVRLHSFDWNGDGREELIIGDAQVNMAYVVFGQENPVALAPVLARADWLIEGAQNGEQLGFALGNGDLDGDGGQDLIIGSRSYNASGHPAFFEDAGAVYVFYGWPPAPPVGDVVYLPVTWRP